MITGEAGAQWSTLVILLRSPRCFALLPCLPRLNHRQMQKLMKDKLNQLKFY